MYNILYYIPNLSKDYGGVYQYSYALLSILAKSDNTFYLFYKNEENDIIQLAEKYKNLHLITKKETVEPFILRLKRKVKRISNKILIKTPLNFRFKIHYQITPIDYLVKKFNIDIIHCPYQTLQKSTWKIPAITTMHDVQELHFPEFFTSETRANRAVSYKYSIDNADAVIVSYQHIKDDIIKFFNKPETKIHICLLDMQNLWFEKFSIADMVDFKEYNIPDDFILYPATTWQHKNHIKLIEAINELNKTKKITINLVCTGKKTEYFSEIERVIKKYHLEKQVFFLGIVPDLVLFSLYNKTKATIIPTLYEAGSFPLMESILMGIPVICSNVTSLPETIGDNSYTFDPLDIEDIANKIFKILFDKEYRYQNYEIIKKQALKLNKNETIKKINSIYSKIVT